MTKAECARKIVEMLPDVLEYLEKEADRLMNCGGIDLDAWPDTFGAPKIILSVALENAAAQYTPAAWQKAELSELKNLRHF